MDTELARTFLAVVAAGNFSRAAARLFVTQSTVSTRIATLEAQLGCRLFERNVGGAELTPQGRWFQPQATQLVRLVERMRQDIGVASGFDGSVSIGGRFGLWDGLLLDVLPRISELEPQLAVRAEIGFEDELMQGLVEGRLDIGVMYTPQHRPGLQVRLLHEETLVYVTTDADEDRLPGPGYVYVDWGPEFGNRHSASFPEFAGAPISANIGWLGLRHITAHGGCGYFPLRLVAGEVAAGRLHRRPSAPDFRLPAWIVVSAAPDNPMTPGVVELIERVTREVVGREPVAH